MSQTGNVWEYLPDTDQLREHLVEDDAELTVCGLPPYSPAGAADVDPDGQYDEDRWFSDHDREPEAIVLCAACGVTEPHHTGG